MGGTLKQVGRLGLAVVGAYFGGPLGFALGSMAGGMLFPDKQRLQDQHGPRLGESQLTSSEYGVGIPKIWGTYRVSGNIIWASPVREVRRSTTHRISGGKGGGSSSKQTTHEYFYYQSFALALCAGEAQRVTKMFFDGELVYDMTRGAGGKVAEGLRFRFYPGDEEQLPDSIIEAREGVGNVSAHRGLCYLVFDELDITNYRRIPQIDVIVQMVGDSTVLRDAFDHSAGTGAVNLESRVKANSPIEPTAQLLSLDTLELLRTEPIDYTRDLELIGPAPKGDFFAANSGLFHRGLYLIDGFTLQAKAAIRTAEWHPRFLRDRYSSFLHYSVLNTEHILFIGHRNFYSAFEAYDVLGNAATVTVEGAPPSRRFSSSCWAYRGVCYFIGNDHSQPNSLFIYASELIEEIADDPVTSSPVVHLTVRLQLVKTFTDLDLDPTGKLLPFPPQQLYNPLVDGVVYDYADDCLLLSIADFYLTVKIRCADWSIKWRFYSEPDAVLDWGDTNKTLPLGQDISAGTWFVDRPGHAYLIETSTGRFIRKFPSVELPVLGDFVYSSREKAAYSTSNSSVLYFDRAPSQRVSVFSILEDLRQEVQAVPSDYSDIVDFEVDGYARVSPQASRSMIEPLANVFSFDAVDAGTHLRWVTRGGDSLGDIARDDLAARERDVIEFKRVQEVELPRLVSITYADLSRDVEQSTYHASRYSGNEIYNTQRSNNQVSIEAPMAIRSDEVKRRADTLLREAWNSRDSATFSAPRWMLEYDVGDVVTVLTPGRVPQDMRLDGFVVGSNLEVELSATSQDSSQYNSVVEAEEGDGFIDQQILTARDLMTRLYMLPIPLLTDSTDRGRQEMVVQFAMGAFTDKWRAGILEHNISSGFEVVSSVNEDAAHGNVLGFVPIADPGTVFSTDEQATIRVALANGALDSVTQEELLEGANAAAIIHSDSRAEVIQFRTATLDDDGNYTLSGILRGRRGTDYWATSFDSPSSAAFVLLAPETVNGVLVPLSELGGSRLYRGSEARQEQGMGDTKGVQFLGIDLMPYAPVHLESLGEIGSEDVLLNWQRRARIRADLASGTGIVPLQEDSESYEIDIYINSNLKRTLTASTNAATYTTAQQAADDVGTFDLVEWVVYQVSAQVGRGFPSSRAKLQGIAIDVAQQSAVLLRELGPSDVDVAQQSAVVLQTTESSLHVAQQSVILLHEEFELPPMDVAQQSNIVVFDMTSPQPMDVAQQSVIALREV